MAVSGGMVMSQHTLIYYQILQYQPENLRLLHDNFEVITLPDPDHDTVDILRRADVILASLRFYCGQEKIDQAPNLKVIGSNTTGHSHIDVDYARKKDIRVVTLKGYQEFLRTITPTAELTWALLIAIVRNVFPAYHSVLRGEWDRRPFGGPAMLSRMSLGIAGYGRLGSMVASYGKCFDMKVRYYDPNVSSDDPDIERVDSLEELVAASDVVTIHIPHEPETENLFNEKIFARFKEGSYLVNTSRGEIVDSMALLNALKSGKLAGAALDVLDGEFEQGFVGRVRQHPLVEYARAHDNLLITPHIGGSTVDAWRLTEEHTINLILKSLREKVSH
jgi:D-3-phosphoglycerate dehydrogenase